MDALPIQHGRVSPLHDWAAFDSEAVTEEAHMFVFDSQLHEPSAALQWSDAPERVKWDVLHELQIAYMRSAGVDAALLCPLDLGWGDDAVRRFPDRFALVLTVGALVFGGMDPTQATTVDAIRQRAEERRLSAIRVVLTTNEGFTLDQFEPAVAACERHGLPVFVNATGELEHVRTIAAAHPDMPVILDHFGHNQTPPMHRLDTAFEELPDLLALADQPNVYVKLSGAPSLSRDPYPFGDLWPRLHKIIDAFGPRRIMWGSDISRFIGRFGFTASMPWGKDPHYVPGHSYAESVLYLRETDELSIETKDWILGRTLADLIDWRIPTLNGSR